MKCPNCGAQEFEIVTLESTLQRLEFDGQGNVDWGEPITLGVHGLLELACISCGAELTNDETVKRAMVASLS
jgi:hypothetical protein